MQFWTQATETGSKQQLESDRNVYSHPPSSLYFWKGSWQTPQKITVSIEGRAIISLRIADDIDGLSGEEEELVNLVERLDKASTAYAIKISAKKTKPMTNNTSGINTEIKMNGQKLETVASFKYLGSVK